MYFEKLHIDSFGPLKNRDLELGPGLNLIFGENESGKSTVCDFILFLLYGLDKNARTAKANWDTGYLGGYGVVRHDGEAYRIERESRDGKDSVQIVRISDGETLKKTTVPGEYFLGVPETLFASVAYVSQKGGSAVEGKSVISAIENLLFSGDETVSARKALQKLDTYRVALLHKNKKGGRIYQLQTECDQLDAMLAAAKADQARIIEKEALLASWNKTLTQVEDELKTVSDSRALIGAEKNCRLFDSLHGIEAKEKELTARKAELDAQNRKAGYLPDYLYQNELETAIRDESIRQEQYRSAQSEYQTVKESIPDAAERAARLEPILRCGGFDAVRDRLRALDKKEKTRRVWGWILIILLPLGLWLLYSARKAEKEKEALLREIGIPPLRDPYAELDIDERDMNLLQDHEAALATRRETAQAQKELLTQAQDTLRALCEKWDHDDPAAALDACRSYLNDKQTILDGLTDVRHEKELCLARLQGADEDAARETLSSLTLRGISADTPTEELERRLRYADGQRASLIDGIRRTELELASLRASVREPAPLAELFCAKHRELQTLNARYDALTLAYDRLEAAATHLRESISPRLTESAGQKMGKVTDGKYPFLGVAPDLGLRYTENGADGSMRTREVQSLSAGTEDLAYVSLRLSLADLVFADRGIPFVFDETFARTDDRRLARLLRLLAENAKEDDGQILLLTCTDREQRQIGDLPHRYVTL